jgi:uncharacterized repeat protein (TIGR01451 family)
MKIRSIIVLTLVVGLMAALPASAGKPSAPNSVTTDLAASRSLGATVRNAGEAFGDNLFTIDVSAATGHQLILGVEYLNGEYWVTSGGAASSADPNFYFQLDSTGTVINSWPQPTTSVWGWRDLAFDGTYLYTSDSNVLVEIDPADGQPTGTTIPCPENPCRALAYDPGSDHFFTANFSSSIYEFDRTGTVINTFPNSLTLYGFAFDGTNLWGCSQDPNVNVTALDPATGAATGPAFVGDGSGGGTPISGGCSYSASVVPGSEVLVVMHQATADTIVGYDVGGYVAPPSCSDPGWTVVFDEPFDGGFPGVMSVVNNGGNCTWTDEVGSDGNLTGGSGSLADADADECGSGTTMNTTMSTAAIPLAGAAVVGLQFNQDYRHLGTSSATVEVSPDGSAWTQVWQRTADERGPSEFFLDLTPELGGVANGYVRFTYIAPGWDWWWQVDNIQLCTSTGVVADADLEVRKTAITTSPTSAVYTINVENLGPDDATGVVVTDPLPAGVTYVSDDCGGVMGTPWTWTIGGLVAGNDVSCNITVDVIDFGDTANVATVAGDQNDPNGGNNSSTANIQQFGGPIPTLGTTGAVLLIILMAGIGVVVMRRLF